MVLGAVFLLSLWCSKNLRGNQVTNEAWYMGMRGVLHSDTGLLHLKNQPPEPLVLALCTPAGQADSSTPVAFGFSAAHVCVTFLVMPFCPSLLVHLCVPKAWFLFVEETACGEETA